MEIGIGPEAVMIPGSSARRKRPAGSGSASQRSSRQRSVRNTFHTSVSLGHVPALLILKRSVIHHESTNSLATQPRHPRSPHREYEGPLLRPHVDKWPTASRGSKSCQAGRQLRFSPRLFITYHHRLEIGSVVVAQRDFCRSSSSVMATRVLDFPCSALGSCLYCVSSSRV